MTVAFDANTVNQTTASFTHTPVGVPRGVLVLTRMTSTGAEPADALTGVTYGGVSLTRVGTAAIGDSSALDGGRCYAYFLGSGIPSGSQTVSVSGGGWSRAECFTVTADTDTEVVDSVFFAQLASGGVANPQETVSLGGRSSWAAMVGVSGNGNIGNIGPLTGWTQLSEVDHGNQTSRCDRLTTATATDFDIGFSQAIGQTAVIAGAAISEVVAGGPPTLTALSASLITATGARLTVTA